MIRSMKARLPSRRNKMKIINALTAPESPNPHVFLIS